ncbi:MAG TPA: hypothetical protein VNZ22_08400, partial [Bacillota bacterium]|nr:hypothetical protein [Bacillota bacterium]
EKSLILLAPLARAAGGYGLCRTGQGLATNGQAPAVFTSTADPGYQALLAMCRAGERKLQEIKRFDMPGFKPRPEYVREMKRYGILPESFDLARDSIDVYAVDRKYWESLWFQPGHFAGR